MGHYYDKAGNPVYEVPNASKPGTLRPTKITDAKKLKLLPSVTEVMGGWKSEGLTNWRMGNYARAGYEFARNGEPYEAVKDQIATIAENVSAGARDYGTGWHAIVEEFAKGNTPTVAPEYQAAWDAFRKWWDANVERVEFAERCLVGQGYAGKCDLCYVHKDGRRLIADYKTQSTKPGKPVSLWESYPKQLAAYAVAYEGQSNLSVDGLQSIIVSSTEPGRVEAHEYHKSINYYHGLFYGLFLNWVFDNDYDPRNATMTTAEKCAAVGL
jgi:hypothetical protein